MIELLKRITFHLTLTRRDCASSTIPLYRWVNQEPVGPVDFDDGLVTNEHLNEERSRGKHALVGR
jgi:hypothetical protein